jgi:hypothetical protein
MPCVEGAKHRGRIEPSACDGAEPVDEHLLACVGAQVFAHPRRATEARAPVEQGEQTAVVLAEVEIDLHAVAERRIEAREVELGRFDDVAVGVEDLRGEVAHQSTPMWAGSRRSISDSNRLRICAA